jgi:lipid A disaccharide synthetase
MKEWTRRSCAQAGVPSLVCRASDVLSAFDVAIAASGTVTLECALSGTPPVIVHRLPFGTAWLAKRLLLTPHIGLPNIVLEEPAFPELIADTLRPQLIADAAEHLLDSPAAKRACARVDDTLCAPLLTDASPSARVASLLEPWLP